MNKKILISASIIVICIGIVALIFFETDMMKSDEYLFGKYMSKNIEIRNEKNIILNDLSLISLLKK